MAEEVLRVKLTGDDKGLTAATKKAGQSLDNFKNKVKQLPAVQDRAAQSLNNLSRIAQDAPYGFIGISNNLNPMLESFQRLQKETGSATGALKAMVSGLTGAGGLGLAIGVVSSAAVVLQAAFREKKKEAGEVSETLTEGAKALREYQKEAAALSNRLKELANEFKFLNAVGSINLEIGFEDKSKAGLLDLQARMLGLNEEFLQAQNNIDKLGKSLVDVKLTPGVKPEEIDAATKLWMDAGKERERIDNERTINARQQELLKTRDFRQAEGERKRIAEQNAKEAARLRKKEADEYLNAWKGVMVQIQNMRPKNLNSMLPELPKLQSVPAVDPYVVEKGDAQRWLDAQEALKKYHEEMQQLSKTVSGLVAPAFQNMFGAILQGENALRAFFDGIKQSIQQVINQLISAAIQAAALSLFTGGLSNGGLSFIGAFKKVTGLARGGIVPAGYDNDSFPAMLSSREAVIPLNKMDQYVGRKGVQDVNFVGRLRGTDIYLQQDRTKRHLRRVK